MAAPFQIGEQTFRDDAFRESWHCWTMGDLGMFLNFSTGNLECVQTVLYERIKRSVKLD